jgi:uncharacterized protein
VTSNDYLNILPDFCHSLIARLKKDLASNIYYHSADHTLDVIHESYLFAKEDNLTAREIELLLIAATFHDAGFLYPASGDEEIACDMVTIQMKQSGNYTDEEISLVRTAIMDTKLLFDPEKNLAHQLPTTKISNYLLDADMSNLGRDDFFKKAELVAKEHGKNFNDQRFIEQTWRVCNSKVWYTDAAKKLRQLKHKSNIAQLSKLIA